MKAIDKTTWMLDKFPSSKKFFEKMDIIVKELKQSGYSKTFDELEAERLEAENVREI